MEKFVIEGGVPLSGTITPAGNKNGALPILAACLLTEDEVILRNVPRISDVEAMVGLLESLGARVTWIGPERGRRRRLGGRPHRGRPRARRADPGLVPARRTAARAFRPRADAAARRRRDRPPAARSRTSTPSAQLGATVRAGRDIELQAPALGLRPCDFLMDEPSVMATENALMAAALTRGTTVIRNAASEPHVQDLARMLDRDGRADRRDRLERDDRARHRPAARLHAHDRPRPHRDRLVHGARRRDRRRAGRQGHRPRGSPDDPARVRAPRAAQRASRQRRDRPRRPGAEDPQRRRRPHAEGPGRPVAGVPGRPDEHRARARDPGRGLGDHPRVDVREPARSSPTSCS